MGYTDGNIIIGTTVDMYGMNTGLKKIEKSVKKLQYSLGAALGIGVFSFGAIGKAALNAASDLQEVQNIVDVAFGDMADMANNFADIAIEKFGMSELAAKQTAGSFMAMGKALGIAEEDAAKMAIRLSALSGDMASFYNISQDYARVALSAVYTGETETLKRYGIVLTEANLQEYAHTLGIETKIKAMDASSKAMLRYNYILEQTKMIEGDFVRTQNTWANQTRILQQRWKQLLVTMGNGLITILTPAIKAMNAFIQKVINFANTIGSILGRLFHIQWQDLSAGTDGAGASLGDLGDLANDAADGLDNVGNSSKKAGKKVKNNLAPFDDLQVLMQKTADGADDADSALDKLEIPDLDMGNYGGGGGVRGGWGEWLVPDINDLFELGRWLSDMLLEALQSIDWNSIYEAAKRFGRGLADFLNGFITPELFYEVGRTLANALNTAIYAALEFGKYFDWKNLGNSIAASINGFFKNFDFKSLAHTINVWAKGLLTTISTTLRKVDWDLIGEQIGTFLKEIDWIGILKQVVEVIIDAFNAAFKLYDKLLETAPVETLFLSFFALGKFLTSDIFLGAISALQTFGTFLTALGTGAAATAAITELRNMSPVLAGIVDMITAIQIAWEAAVAAFTAASGTLTGIGAGISTFLLSLHELINPVIAAIGGIIAAIAEFFTIKEQLLDIARTSKDDIAGLIINITELTVAFGAFTAILVVCFGEVGVLISIITALSATVVGLIEYINSITSEAFDLAFKSMIESTEGAGHTLSDFKGIMLDVTDSVIRDANTMSEKFKSLEDTRGSIDNVVLGIESIGLAMQSQTQLTSSEVETLKGCFSSLKDLLADAIAASYDYVITQITLDMMYLRSIGQLSEEQERAYTDQLARLQEEKQAVIDNSAAILESMDTNLSAYSEAANKYKETQEAYKEGRATAEEVQQAYDDMTTAYNNFHSSLNEGMGALENAGLINDDYSDKVKETKRSIDDLSGSLDLSNQKINDVNGLSTQVVTALGDIKRSYDDGKAAIEDMSSKYEEELNNMNISDEERERLLALHKQRVQQNMDEIQQAYNGSLTAIQQDLLTLVPQAVEEFGRQWDEGNIDGTFLGFTRKEDYIKSQMNSFINQLYNEQLTTELNTALEATAGAVEPTAQETSEKIIKNLTEVDTKAYWDYWGEVQGGNITAATQIAVQEAQDPTFQNFTQFGQGTIQAYDTGMNDRSFWTQVQGHINEFATSIKNWFHNSVLRFGSPSRTFIEFGQNTIEGYNQGINEKTSSSITQVNTWVDGIVNAFMATDKFSQFIPMLEQTIFSPLKERLSTVLEEVTLIIDTWWVTFQETYFNYDTWLTMLNETVLLAIMDFLNLSFLVEWDTFIQDWWDNHLLVWFTDSKWQTDVFGPWFTHLQTKWRQFIEWWDKSIKDWWQNHLLNPWVQNNKWDTDVYDPIKKNMRDTHWTNSFLKWWDEVIEDWWKNHLLEPWTTDKKWDTDVYNPIKKNMRDIHWKQFIDWWDNVIEDWWTHHVLDPWTKDKKWDDDIYDPIKKNMRDTHWKSFIKWWDTTIKDWWDNHVQTWVDKFLETFDDIMDHIKTGTDETFTEVERVISEKIAEAQRAVEEACEEMIRAIQAVMAAMEALNSMGGGGGGSSSSSSGSYSSGGRSGGPNSFMPMFDVMHFEDNLGMSAFRFPELATGAVIPPNKPFMAMLGDQKHGTNIETPLNTMLEAFRAAMADYMPSTTPENAVMQVDGETFARLMLPYILDEMNRQGYNTEIIEGM